MPLVGTKANASAFGLGWSSAQAAEVLGGMVLMTPTSIASTGTGNSSSIGTNGSVTFSSCATLSLNGVFTSEYDNYMIVCRHSTSGSSTIGGRLRAFGTDASGNDYVRQRLNADGTTVSGTRNTANELDINLAANSQRIGWTMYVFGPNLSQATAFRSITVSDSSDARIFDYAMTHSLSTSYDGITFYPQAAVTFTGLVSVYGLGG